MKKVLFLTRSYPDSQRSASVLCTHRVIEIVQKAGRHEVHVLCYNYNNDKCEENINGIFVHRFKPTLWSQMRNQLSLSNRHLFFLKVMDVLQKAFAIPWYPSLQPLTYFLLKKEAKKLYLKEKYDLVVSVHHSVEMLKCACYLARNYERLKHVAILWDPIRGQIPSRFVPKFYASRGIDKLEQLSIQFADAIISTGTMRDYYSTQIDKGLGKRHFLGFPGIIRPDEEIETKYLHVLKQDAINIVYSGQLSMLQRNPMPVIELLNKCVFANKINLIFFSAGDARSAIENACFKGTISYNGYIPLNELHTIYSHADYLLNISHINEKMVPSKLFEYMSYGKPIISTYITDGDSAEKYVGRYSEGLCINLKNTDEENVKALNAFLEKEHKIVPFDIVNEQFMENTPERYLEVIDRIIAL